MLTSKEELQRFNRWSDHRKGHVILYALCFVLSCSTALSFYMTKQNTQDQCFVHADFTYKPDPLPSILFPNQPTGCRYVYAAFLLSGVISFIFGWFCAAFGASVESFLQGRSSIQRLLPITLIFIVPVAIMVVAATGLIQKGLVDWCVWMKETGKVHSCFTEPWKIDVGETTFDAGLLRILAVQICSWLTVLNWLCQIALTAMAIRNTAVIPRSETA